MVQNSLLSLEADERENIKYWVLAYLSTFQVFYLIKLHVIYFMKDAVFRLLWANVIKNSLLETKRKSVCTFTLKLLQARTAM